MEKNERDIQNYINGKSIELENNQENNPGKSEVGRKDRQDIKVQENINVDESNNNNPNNIEIRSELATNESNRNGNKNRNDDTKIGLNESPIAKIQISLKMSIMMLAMLMI